MTISADQWSGNERVRNAQYAQTFDHMKDWLSAVKLDSGVKESTSASSLTYINLATSEVSFLLVSCNVVSMDVLDVALISRSSSKRRCRIQAGTTIPARSGRKSSNTLTKHCESSQPMSTYTNESASR